MSKLSIVFKLLTVLSVLVLSLAGVGVMAIGTMQNINSHTVEIAESWLPSVRALGSHARRHQRAARRAPPAPDAGYCRGQGGRREAPRLAARAHRQDPQGLRAADHGRGRALALRAMDQGVGRISERRAGDHGAVAQERRPLPDRRQRVAADQGREDGAGGRSAASEGHRAQQPWRRAGDETGGRKLRVRSSACWSASSSRPS